MTNRLPERRCEQLLFAIVAILMGWLYSIVPLYADDLWYLPQSVREFKPGVEAMMQTFKEAWSHTDYDTGRLANLLTAPFLALLPKWVFGLLTAAIIYLTLSVGARLASPKGRMVYSVLFMLIYVVVLPWFDTMLTVVFSMNYVWTSACVLVLLYYYLTHFGERRRKICAAAGLCVLAYVTGWMHEGASVPLLCGLGAYMLTRRRELNWHDLLVPAALLAGLVTLLSFPALWTRAGETGSKLLEHSAVERAVSVVAFNCMTYVYLLTLAVALVRKWPMDDKEKALTAFFVTFGVVGTGIFLMYYSGQRVGWFNQLICGIGTVRLLALRPGSGRHGRMANVATVVLSAVVIVNLVCSIAAQRKLSREWREVTQLAQTTASGSIFCDVTPPRLDMTLYKTSVRALNERNSLATLRDFYAPEGVEAVSVLPNRLKWVRAEECEPTEDGLLIYEGMLLAPANQQLAADKVEVELEGVGRLSSRFRVEQFRSEGDGRSYMYLIPHMQLMTGADVVSARFFH